MSLLFLTDREDPVLHSAYRYFSGMLECRYSDSQPPGYSPSIIITNHIIASGKTVFHYVTGAIPTDTDWRRRFAAFAGRADEVFSSSVWLGRWVFENFKVRCLVQYPFVPEGESRGTHVAHTPGFPVPDGMGLLAEVRTPSDVADAKIFLHSSPLLMDINLCVAAAHGVPVLTRDAPQFREFLGPADRAFTDETPVQLRVIEARRLLKEAGRVKERSTKYSTMSAMEDKIRKALQKKPSSVAQLPPSAPRQNIVRGRNKRTVVHEVQAPPPAPPTDKTVYITGAIRGLSGYDNFVLEVARGLKSTGADVRISGTSPVNYAICPSYFREMHTAKHPEAWEIIIMPPCNLPGQVPGKRSVVYTMWETDKLEPPWVAMLNLAALVVVPSQWAVDSFRRCGVTVPIYKIPLGYDPLVFNPWDCSGGSLRGFPRTCTFGTAAALSAGGLRKNTGQMVGLFKRAFPGRQDVRLKIKITPSCPFDDPRDDRVEVTRDYLPPPELAAWYRGTTAFINGSYAEGFGLHLIESMACGRAIITTQYSAVTEYFDEEVGYPVGHKIVPAKGDAYTGHWAKPDEEDMIRQMRWVHSNPADCMARGDAAAHRARNFTWKRMGQALVRVLAENGILNYGE